MFRCPDIQISRCQIPDTRHQIPGIRYQISGMRMCPQGRVGGRVMLDYCAAMVASLSSKGSVDLKKRLRLMPTRFGVWIFQFSKAGPICYQASRGLILSLQTNKINKVTHTHTHTHIHTYTHTHS